MPAFPITVAGDLCREACCVGADTRNRRVFELFEADPGLASIPVLEGERIVGLINRDRFMRAMERRFHWELYSGKRCTKMMDRDHLIVAADTPLRELASGLLDVGNPRHLSEGFVIVADGKPVGTGLTSDVLAAILMLERATADALREENALAQEIIERITLRHGLADERLCYWVQAAENFSGDVIAAALSKRGVLHVLLADATGHGLTAAISVVPILTLFYRLAELNRSLERVVLEMNRELRETMPTGRFVAATLLSYDQRSGQVRLWQGGMPEVLHLDAEGNILARHASEQLPLGIMDAAEGMTAIRSFSVSNGDQIVLLSDGLIEAENQAGEAFGIERVEQALRKSRNKEQLRSLQSALRRHVGTRPPHDDISVLVVNCGTG